MTSEGSPEKRPRLGQSKRRMQEREDMDTDMGQNLCEGAGAQVRGQDAGQRSPHAPWNKWSVDELAQELQNWGIPEDAVQKFRAHKIEGRFLDRITTEHVRDVLEIQELGTQLKIQDFLLEKITVEDLDGSKVFNDPVHGHMEFHPLCVAIIDTPEFQRLRYLKQLGACYFVYPGACHNRFEHSLGVCYLAGLLVNALRKRQPELGITARDVLCVEIAGLCHDLGHGPFSHLYDRKFIPYVRPHRKWEHEDASIEMFDHMVKENKQLESVFERYGITAAERIFIQEQITGKCLTPCADSKKMTQYYGPESGKAFLYEIVANKRNGVDVDKWDYFKRDCLHLGISSSFDHMRFIQFSRVIWVGNEQQICVRDKEAFNMYEMFHTRHALHRRAYQHRVVQAVEMMLVEAMREADSYILTPGKKRQDEELRTDNLYTISQCIDDMDAYINLTDNIFHRILLSEDSHLEKARTILQDIQKRKLYKCVGETEPITDEDIINKTGEDIRKEILDELPKEKEEGGLLELDTSRFVVQMVSLDYGKKYENPVNNIRFFSKVDKTKAVAVKASEISYMLPQELFKEQLVRVFLRPTEDKAVDEQCLQLLLNGFELWCKKNNLHKPKNTSWIPLTPYKPDDPAVDNCVTPNRPVSITKPVSMTKARQSLTF